MPETNKNLSKNGEIIKILILGLDNAGKTSILLCLKKDTNLLSFYRLKPTKGLKITDIEDSDQNYSIWDFGGQSQYRNSHLKNLNKKIYATNKIIFVFDVQDHNRYDEAIDFLEKILKIIEEVDPSIKLSIYLHKLDPNIETINKSISEELILNLINKIKEKIPKNIEYEFFKTSIYTVFRKISVS